MDINKINSINNNDYVKINKKENINNGNITDKVEISNAALEKSELDRIIEIVKSVPDVRADRVAEIKKKLEDPNYINDRVSATAEKIMESFNI